MFTNENETEYYVVITKKRGVFCVLMGEDFQDQQRRSPAD